MILLRNQPPLSVLSLDSLSLLRYGSRRQKTMDENKSIFRFLSPQEREVLEVGSKIKELTRREILFREGDTPSGIFLLQVGKVKVFKIGSDGAQQIVRLAKPGDLIGYRALLSEEIYNATAETLEESTLCFYRKDSFLKVFHQSSTLIPHFVEHLCNDLRFAEDRLLDFVQKPARERVAATLVLLMEAYGRPAKKGQILIDAQLTRKEIAELSGVVLETAVRLLGDLKEEGLVGFEGRKICIHDKLKLLEISDTSAHWVSWR